MSDSGEEKEIKLSARHQKFVEAILAGKNHTDAYLAAGYKRRDRLKVGKAAYNLWKKVEIQNEIKRRKTILFEQYKEAMDAQVADAIEARGRLVNYPNFGSATQMKAIADVLDRAGFKPKEETDVGGTIKIDHSITLEDLIRYDRDNGKGQDK